MKYHNGCMIWIFYLLNGLYSRVRADPVILARTAYHRVVQTHELWRVGGEELELAERQIDFGYARTFL